jgi:hypothetical protein
MTKMREGIQKLSWRIIVGLVGLFFIVVVVPAVVLGLPGLVSVPVMTGMMQGIAADIRDSEQQYEKSLPLLGDMGYEVTSFKVVGGGWGLLPWAKLCLRSKVTTKNPSECSNLQQTKKKADSDGLLMSTLVDCAYEAKTFQCSYKRTTAGP